MGKFDGVLTLAVGVLTSSYQYRFYHGFYDFMEEAIMLDLVFVAITVILFALGSAYVYGCDRV